MAIAGISQYALTFSTGSREIWSVFLKNQFFVDCEFFSCADIVPESSQGTLTFSVVWGLLKIRLHPVHARKVLKFLLKSAGFRSAKNSGAGSTSLAPPDPGLCLLWALCILLHALNFLRCFMCFMCWPVQVNQVGMVRDHPSHELKIDGVAL